MRRKSVILVIILIAFLFFVIIWLTINLFRISGDYLASGDAFKESKTIINSENIPLPDTIFPSLWVLDYKLRYYDTLTSGILDTLANLYSESPGVFTFRGGPLRDHPFIGRVTGRPSEIVTDWEFRTAFDTTMTDFGRWGGGTGWTGQPLFIQWPDSLINRFEGISDTLIFKTPSDEVIFGSLCGNLYFLDYQTGNPTRRPIEINNIIKGTPGIDPAMNGFLFTGHGVPRDSLFGISVIDLFTHSKKQFISGKDSFSRRGWGAFDSSPVAVGQFLFWPGENGVVYKFLRTSEGLKIHSALRYTVKGRGAPGIESSMAVYKNYGYFGDNHGNIICLNLNTMVPVWHFHNLDDTDASPVILIEKGIPYLFTGCEVDRQGNTGVSQFTKLNALNGSVVWQQKFPCRTKVTESKRYNGGMLSTPLNGAGDCKELIFSIISFPDSSWNSDLVAVQKRDGEVVYKLRLDGWAWSSPVPFYNEYDELFILTGDVKGNVYLIKGINGNILIKKRIGLNFESSPLVRDNCVIFGSRGRTVYKLSIR